MSLVFNTKKYSASRRFLLTEVFHLATLPHMNTMPFRYSSPPDEPSLCPRCQSRHCVCVESVTGIATNGALTLTLGVTYSGTGTDLNEILESMPPASECSCMPCPECNGTARITVKVRPEYEGEDATEETLDCPCCLTGIAKTCEACEAKESL